jgi:hypothetical protein
MVKAARAHERTVQVGMHRRIGPHHVSGMKFLKEGVAGEIGMIRAFAHSPGGVETPTPNDPVPMNLDWDLYCGPAPLRPFNKRIHPGGFRNYLDFANGILGDWGVHWLDQILWWSEEKHPKTIFSAGGRPVKGPVVLNEKEQTSDSPATRHWTLRWCAQCSREPYMEPRKDGARTSRGRSSNYPQFEVMYVCRADAIEYPAVPVRGVWARWVSRCCDGVTAWKNRRRRLFGFCVWGPRPRLRPLRLRPPCFYGLRLRFVVHSSAAAR